MWGDHTPACTPSESDCRRGGIPKEAPGTAIQNLDEPEGSPLHRTFLGLGALILWDRHQYPAAGMGVSTASIHPIGHGYKRRSSTPLGRTLCFIPMQSPTGGSRTLFCQFLGSGRERHLRVCSFLARRHIALLTAEQGLLFFISLSFRYNGTAAYHLGGCRALQLWLWGGGHVPTPTPGSYS